MESAESGPALVWNIATDGSKGSNIAFTLGVDNLMRAGYKVVVSHVYDSGKTYLPKYLQSSYMREMIEAQLLGKLNPEQFKLEFQAKDKKLSVSQMVDEISITNKASVLAVGIHG